MQGRRDTTTLTTPTRFLAAFGFSLGCHATLLLALALVPFRAAVIPSDRPIVVAVVGDEGAGDSAESGTTGGEVGAATAEAPHALAAVRDETHDVPRPPPATRKHRRVLADAPAAGDGAASIRDAAAATRGGDPSTAGSAGTGAEPDGGEAGGDSGGGSRVAGLGTGRGRGSGGGDLRPWCANCPTPEYPARARRQGWQGTVDVELRVGRDGAVEQASIGRSSGFAILDAAAVTVARQSRFRVADGTELHGQLRYRFLLEALDRPL